MAHDSASPLLIPFSRISRVRLAAAATFPKGPSHVNHGLSRSYPTFIAFTGSCARPQSSCRLRFSLFRQVLAGCCEPLLEDGPSRRSLCGLYIDAWVCTPPRPNGAFRPFLPVGHRPPLRRLQRQNDQHVVTNFLSCCYISVYNSLKAAFYPSLSCRKYRNYD